MMISQTAVVICKGRYGGYEGKLRVSYTDAWKGGSYLVASEIERLTETDARLDGEQLQRDWEPQRRD